MPMEDERRLHPICTSSACVPPPNRFSTRLTAVAGFVCSPLPAAVGLYTHFKPERVEPKMRAERDGCGLAPGIIRWKCKVRWEVDDWVAR
ncbi:hypothetical protein BD626DRAFT_89111 [Schizophyllum amplum]|uniref:Uncharacterized protein n=1 Tax=Schizophyllum amplum TaxID=97359 RepID=A0A550C8M2_9AGAR|nr:hypothetical protein BD626DRAFT_89111 [Auriculariopsis ampla]